MRCGWKGSKGQRTPPVLALGGESSTSEAGGCDAAAPAAGGGDDAAAAAAAAGPPPPLPPPHANAAVVGSRRKPVGCRSAKGRRCCVSNTGAAKLYGSGPGGGGAQNFNLASMMAVHPAAASLAVL